jgi:hypothetical protein
MRVGHQRAEFLDHIHVAGSLTEREDPLGSLLGAS